MQALRPTVPPAVAPAEAPVIPFLYGAPPSPWEVALENARKRVEQARVNSQKAADAYAAPRDTGVDAQGQLDLSEVDAQQKELDELKKLLNGMKPTQQAALPPDIPEPVYDPAPMQRAGALPTGGAGLVAGLLGLLDPQAGAAATRGLIAGAADAANRDFANREAQWKVQMQQAAAKHEADSKARDEKIRRDQAIAAGATEYDMRRMGLLTEIAKSGINLATAKARAEASRQLGADNAKDKMLYQSANLANRELQEATKALDDELRASGQNNAEAGRNARQERELRFREQEGERNRAAQVGLKKLGIDAAAEMAHDRIAAEWRQTQAKIAAAAKRAGKAGGGMTASLLSEIMSTGDKAASSAENMVKLLQGSISELEKTLLWNYQGAKEYRPNLTEEQFNKERVAAKKSIDEMYHRIIKVREEGAAAAAAKRQAALDWASKALPQDGPVDLIGPMGSMPPSGTSGLPGLPGVGLPGMPRSGLPMLPFKVTVSKTKKR